ncbi:MAG: ZIP family metal transporter [Firmicutes bacterium]|nr:ZIP family metal transporter [Bacillota bacterium]
MINKIFNLSYTYQALIATLFTYFVTALGASIVLFIKKLNKNFMDAMLSCAAGIMIAASFFSLIMPAISMADDLKMVPFIVLSIGFLSGGIFLFICDKLFSKILKNNTNKNKRTLMLIFSISLHNIPEGAAIGVAFGSLFYDLNSATIISAWMLALGIGIQNFPEGAAISLPLRRDGYSRKKAFFLGQLSGIVEPIFGVIGAILVLKVRFLLPFLLSFAAGAMIYVVVEELIPESQSNIKKEVMSLFTLLGFTIMMILDLALG